MSSTPGTTICHVCGYKPPPDTSDQATCPQDGSWLIDEAVHTRFHADPFLGRVIGGKYPVVGVLGAGGMGAVYRAIQQPVGRPVALKVIRDVAGKDPAIRKRFEQEAELVARLGHPNTVTLFDFGFHHDGTLFMVLELVEGHLLSQEIVRGALAPERAAHIVASVLDALVEAHTLGVIHRDLKPDNIMLSQTAWGREDVKVLDFGVAKIMAERPDAERGLTQTGVVFGTARYMAPEQVRRRAVDHRADLYSLGVILYECLTGKVPFDADNTFDILLAHIQKAPDADPMACLPTALRSVLKRALAKRAERRYGSAHEMAAAVRGAAGLPDHTPSVPAVGAAGLATPSPDGPRDDTRTSQELSAEIVSRQERGAERGWLLPAAVVAATTGDKPLACMTAVLVTTEGVTTNVSLSSSPCTVMVSVAPVFETFACSTPAKLTVPTPPPVTVASMAEGGTMPRVTTTPAVPSPFTFATSEAEGSPPPRFTVV